MRYFFRTLAGNTLLKIGLGVTLIIAIASAVSYYLIYKEIEQGVRAQIGQYVVQRAKSLQADFVLAQDMHGVFKRELLASLAQPPPRDALRRFDELFTRYPDGAIRSRPEDIGAPPYITGWIRRGVALTAELRRRFVLYYDLARRFTPVALVRSYDFWISSPKQAYIGSDPPEMPNWVSNAPADFDLNFFEAVATADQKHNPDRETRWSGVYTGPIWKLFLVAVSTPIDYEGRHIATIHNDIVLNDLMASTLRSDLEGASHAVFQADGRLIAYKSKMREIRATKGRYFIQKSGDPRLLSLFDAVGGKHALPVTGFDAQADQYQAISRLNGPGWYFATVVPGRLVRAQAFAAAQWVLWAGVASLMLVLAILAVLMRRQIALPLRGLLTATQQMREHQALVSLDTSRHDELGQLAAAFVRTATSIAYQFEQRAQALRHEVKERKRAFEVIEQAKHAAESANRAKSQFLANMSHELRTPLNGILGYAQLLARDSSLTDKQHHSVQVMQRSGEHLLTLINDILDFAKVESRKLELDLSDFDLPELLLAITRESEIKATHKQLAFRQRFGADLPVGVTGDEHKLRQVLSNLVSNAVKFTQAGEVELSARPDGDCIRFEVSDTGSGIRPEELRLLFRPFQQVGDRARRFEGTGLGLAISRAMVELMGGRLKVQSEFGRGSRFWFSVSLPYVDAARLPSDGSEGEVRGYAGPRRRVLIVDDIEVNRAVLRDILSPAGFELAEAQDGEAGVETAAVFKPHLILMDLRMPRMDGLEATRRIRNIEALSQVVIIALSASAYAHHRRQFIDAGADDFLAKPFRQQALFELLRTHLALKFVHAPESPATSIQAKDGQSTAPLICPPQEEWGVFMDLARRGEVRNLLKRAVSLEQSDARYAPFVTELRELAKGFHTRKIRQFLEGLSPSA